ncbi:uncharacterized protein B0H64DRAFT_433188 [Chaetomium fimeti]|uniref:Uncharacterized protein n=1 Tax=Chaetomium fimeti TaxID=1854472 RepID=A0AAE0HCB9_9PEZI|nr:hypothetical protein B0H64DRAFT_433188 [Chaetomium fimeti]
MQYLSVAALLLPATVLANPMVVARQPQAKAKFIGWRLQTGTEVDCGNDVSVAFTELDQLATVSLPNYNVTLPERNGSRDKGCSVILTVRFPVNVCTRGTATGAVSGQVDLSIVGSQAKFHGREYVVSPSGDGVSQVSPDREWTRTAASGPISERYTINDSVTYRYTPPNVENQDVDFTLQGRLQLQPGTGTAGFLSNDRFVFDLRNQDAC